MRHEGSELGLHPSCPIPNTHRRLKEAHQLWHQTVEQYQDPVGFRVNLNAAIQALRNITFVLQKEKKSIPDFESWYGQWRRRMGEDAVLRWLVEARNRIVKEGDLETYSMAKGTIMTWEDYRIGEVSVPPLMPTEAIALLIASEEMAGLPSDVRDTAVLEVERRWVAADLPDWELLEALAHSYGVLSVLVGEAHEKCKFEFRTCEKRDSQGAVIPDTHLLGRLPCMVTTRAVKSVRLKLSEREFVSGEMIPLKLDPEEGKQAAEEYGLVSEDFPKSSKPDDIFEIAEWFVSRAKKVLAKDKYHSGIVALQTRDGRLEFVSMNPADQSEKYLMMQQLADHVGRTGAKGLVHICESWIASPEESVDRGLRVSEAPNRREALSVTAAAEDGRVKSFVTLFSRDQEGEIQLEPTVEVEPGTPYFLERVRKVWRGWRRKNGTFNG